MANTPPTSQGSDVGQDTCWKDHHDGIGALRRSRATLSRRGPAGRGRAGPRGPRRRVHGAGRTVRLRQVDLAADAGRARGVHRGLDHDRRPRRDRRRAQGPRHRDGLPELRALSPHDGRRQHGLRAQGGPRGQGGARRPGPRGRPPARPRGLPRPQAEGALRRPAPARGDGPRDRAPARGVPHGRAAVQPRRQAPRLHPHPDRRPPAAPGRHHGLRHARPDRGDDDGRPGRGAQGRPAPAGRHAPRALRPARQPLRRRLHRLPRDEPDPRDGGSRARP